MADDDAYGLCVCSNSHLALSLAFYSYIFVVVVVVSACFIRFGDQSELSSIRLQDVGLAWRNAFFALTFYGR